MGDKNHSVQRIFGLDILRSFAILFVVYGHGLDILVKNRTLAPHWYNFFVFDGVSLFFVLSGFLIGRILIRTFDTTNFNKADLWDFWIKRWFRTLPNYFLVLCLLIFWSLLAYFRKGIELSFYPAEIYKYFIFTQNFATEHPLFFPEAWSLCVEEWFYLLVPIFLFLVFNLFPKICKQRLILYIICTIMIIIPLIRLARSFNMDLSDAYTWDMVIRKQVISRFDSVMYGVLGAYILHYNTRWWFGNQKKLFIIGLLFIIYPNLHEQLFFEAIWFRTHFTLLFTSFGTLLMLPYLYSIKDMKGWSIAGDFFSFISKISYSMYLLNLSVVQMIAVPLIMKYLEPHLGYGNDKRIFMFIMFIFLTIFLSYLLYRFYEKPMLHLRDRVVIKKENAAH